MNEMLSMKWMKKVLKQIAVERSALGRYYEAEGLCRIESTPPLIVNGAFGGPTLVSMEKSYCIRR